MHSTTCPLLLGNRKTAQKPQNRSSDPRPVNAAALFPVSQVDIYPLGRHGDMMVANNDAERSDQHGKDIHLD